MWWIILFTSCSPFCTTREQAGHSAESRPLTWNHYAEGYARGPQDQPGTDGGGDRRAGCRMIPADGPDLWEPLSLGTHRPKAHADARTRTCPHPSTLQTSPALQMRHAPGARNGQSGDGLGTSWLSRAARGCSSRRSWTCRATSADRARACARPTHGGRRSAWRSWPRCSCPSTHPLERSSPLRACRDDAGHRPGDDD